MDTPAPLRRDRFGAMFLVCFAGLILLAWANRFVQDDAFISFRYAANLAAGEGLVWNPGEPVEGYTNFLWVLALAAGLRLGFEPVGFSMALGLGCFAVSLALTYRLAVVLLRSRGTALLAMFLLGTNFTFSSYATGGLETQLQTGLLAAAAYVFLTSVRDRNWAPGRAALLSTVLGLAVLTRPDSALFCAVLVPAAAISILRKHGPPPARASRLAWLLVPLGAILGGWLLWKLRTYGDILPNTYYLKAASATLPFRGFYYVGSFFARYGLLLVPLVLVVLHRGLPAPLRVRRGHLSTPLVVAVALWLAYVVKIGGDFMEYRFLVPVLPFVFVWIAGAAVDGIGRVPVRVGVIAVLLACSWLHSRARDIGGMETIPDLGLHVGLWAPIGERLGEHFEHDPTVTIATTAAGAIPYYSKLRTIDLLGLNDREIARNGDPLREAPWYGLPTGHQRIARLEYVLARDVHLLLNHPWLVDRDEPREGYTLRELNRWKGNDLAVKIAAVDRLPATARVVEIPISEDRALVALYLTPHPRVDAALARGGWRVFPVVEG